MTEIFIDFDGTICPNKAGTVVGEEYAPPSKECLEVLRNLKKKGFIIVIYSVRSNLQDTKKHNGHTEMIAYLQKHQVPYDYFDSSKKHFVYIIDDKAYGCPLDESGNVDWSKIKIG